MATAVGEPGLRVEEVRHQEGRGRCSHGCCRAHCSERGSLFLSSEDERLRVPQPAGIGSRVVLGSEAGRASMSRIWRRRRAHRDGWTNTAEGWSGSATSQRGTHGASPVVIRASVLGRLLGIRLLRLEADISLFPADLGSYSTVGPSHRVVTSSATTDGTGGLTDAVALLALASRTLDETPHLVTVSERPGPWPR
jgi:hypothetical protein